MKVRTDEEWRLEQAARGKAKHGSSKIGSEKGAKTGPGTGEFSYMNYGGKRKGAGRKAAKGPEGKRLHNPHSARESFTWSRGQSR